MSSTGSIAAYLVNSFTNLPAGISGTMFQTVDYQRLYVQNYTGYNLSSGGFDDKFDPIITNLALANLVDLKISNGDGGLLMLGDLRIHDQGAPLAADQYLKLAEMGLKAIGRKVSFARSLSS